MRASEGRDASERRWREWLRTLVLAAQEEVIVPGEKSVDWFQFWNQNLSLFSFFLCFLFPFSCVTPPSLAHTLSLTYHRRRGARDALRVRRDLRVHPAAREGALRRRRPAPALPHLRKPAQRNLGHGWGGTRTAVEVS